MPRFALQKFKELPAAKDCLARGGRFQLFGRKAMTAQQSIRTFFLDLCVPMTVQIAVEFKL